MIDLYPHTPAPWRFDIGGTGTRGGLLDDHGISVMHVEAVSWTNGGTFSADLQRIVACVNACEGMDDPAAFRKALDFARGEEEKLRTQRDELAAVLRMIAAVPDDDDEPVDGGDLVEWFFETFAPAARAVLAKMQPCTLLFAARDGAVLPRDHAHMQAMAVLAKVPA